jgi:hypothetical protein
MASPRRVADRLLCLARADPRCAFTVMQPKWLLHVMAYDKEKFLYRVMAYDKENFLYRL